VPVVAIDDVDLGFVLVEAAAQPVGGHRAARAAAEDDDPFPRQRFFLRWDVATASPGRGRTASGRPRNRSAENYAHVRGQRDAKVVEVRVTLT